MGMLVPVNVATDITAGTTTTGAFIRAEGFAFPWPDRESGLQTISTMVDGGRNSMGVFIGQRIGRDQSKVELTWYMLDAKLWSTMLQIFKRKFVVPISYYDMEAGDIITRNMYVSDRSGNPGVVDPNTGKWITAKRCKLNLIDTGEEEIDYVSYNLRLLAGNQPKLAG